MRAQRAGPGKDRIIAERDRRPLREIAGQLDHPPRESGDGGGEAEVDRQRCRTALPRSPERQRRHDHRQILAELAEGRRRTRARGPVHRAAHGLAEARDPQREQQPGNADREKGRLPADEPQRTAGGIGVVPRLDDQRADEQRHAAAQIKPRRIDGERGRLLPFREIVGDQRIGGRARGRLADPDAHARERQRELVIGEARKGGHRRP